LDVLIKIYRPNSSVSFPKGGKLTPYLESLTTGDKIHVEGPFGKFGYEAGGNVILSTYIETKMEKNNNSKEYSSWLAEVESLLAIMSFGRLPTCQMRR
jgi:predicted ferric reductase